MERLQTLQCDVDPAPRTSDPRIGAARLDAANAAEPLVDEICERQRRPLFLAFEVENRGRGDTPEQETGRVILRITADLTDAPPHLCECGGYIRGGRGLADTALAVECNFFHKLSSFHGSEELVARLLEVVAIENPRRLLNPVHNVL